MIQATKYQCSQDHPMNTRLKQLSSGRLKRSSFTLVTRALQRKHQEVLPKYVKPIAFTMNNNPREDKLGNVIIQTPVSFITTNDDQTSTVKKTLTMSMLADEYPSDSWVRVYTDGSAISATTKGGAGIYIEYPTEINNHGQYQQAYIVQTTKLKKKPLFMLHTPSKQS
ncbi:unnamed protein product [Mytilus coruscus]|uniref:Uncharacterized protein n=1 Tax=Mytilus coruscus TaxID=42192 RepID=A0A6J8D6P2_MYTCO|nr:unnamed protein product [Mytilus coruscus]